MQPQQIETKFPASDTAYSQLPSKLNAAGDSPFFINLLVAITTAAPTLPNSTAGTTCSSQPLNSAPIVSDAAATPHPSHSLQIPTATPISNSAIPSPIPITSFLDLVPNHVTSDISSSHPMITRSKTGSFRPKNFPDFQLFQTTKYPLICHHTTL